MTRRAVPGVLFLTLFTAYAYFHQGGGWNQNCRFSQVRAVVEEGTWSINSFCAYRARPGDGFRLARVPLPRPVPPGYAAPPLNGLDISVYRGWIYPAKSPGTTILALPAYAIVHGAGALMGADPESWRTLTLGFYLTTVFSIGLVGALGGVLLLTISRRLHPEIPFRGHLAATLGFGLGTIYFPFATMLFDHVAAAVAVLAGFGLATAARRASSRSSRRWRLAAAGFVLGAGVVINYTVLMVVVLCGLYNAVWLRRRFAELAFFALGGALPALFLLAYHTSAFGSPWASAYAYQNPVFLAPEAPLFGAFELPRPAVLYQLLVGSERGLLSSSPVLALTVFGFYAAFARRRGRLEAVFSLGILAAYLLMNASYHHWTGGSSFGPRLVLPALPVVALYLAPALARWPRASGVLAVGSALLVLAATAADPVIPPEIEHPMLEQVLPGFLGPIPVSHNAQGVYEDFAFRVFGPDSLPAHWNSFNLGEFLFPESLASLLPLVAVLLAAAIWLLRVSPCADGPVMAPGGRR